MSNNKDIIKPRRGLPRTNKIILPDCRTWLSLSNFIATMSSDYSMMQLKIIILLSITVLFSQSRSPFMSLILESIVLQLHSRTPGSLSIV